MPHYSHTHNSNIQDVPATCVQSRAGKLFTKEPRC